MYPEVALFNLDQYENSYPSFSDFIPAAQVDCSIGT